MRFLLALAIISAICLVCVLIRPVNESYTYAADGFYWKCPATFEVLPFSEDDI